VVASPPQKLADRGEVKDNTVGRLEHNLSPSSRLSQGNTHAMAMVPFDSFVSLLSYFEPSFSLCHTGSIE
jgi:hypothetical protein